MGISKLIRTLTLSLTLLAVASSVPADTFTVAGEPIEGVYVRESNSGYFVSSPADGSVQYFSKSSDATYSVEFSPKKERQDMSARWQEAHQARVSNQAISDIEIDPERLAELYRESDTDQAASFTDKGTPILRAKGNAKSNPATRARIQSNLARRREAAAGAAFPNVGNPPMTTTTTSGGGQGGQGGGQGGQGGGQGGGGGANFTNISQLFGTVDDVQVGETPNLITGGQSGQGGGFN